MEEPGTSQQQGLYQQLLSIINESVHVIRGKQDSLLDVRGKLVRLPEKGEALILGDLHGDLNTFHRILRETKFIEKVREGRRLFLVCLGDYIDRGPGQVELMKELLMLLVAHPGNGVLLLGNHEGPRDLKVSPQYAVLEIGRLDEEEKRDSTAQTILVVISSENLCHCMIKHK